MLPDIQMRPARGASVVYWLPLEQMVRLYFKSAFSAPSKASTLAVLEE